LKNLLTAIYGKFSGSLLSTDVSGRIYLDEAPEGTAFPYLVYRIVSSSSEDNFDEYIDNTLIQFSLFSEKPGALEISTMYGHLKTLFDDASLTITSTIHLWMVRQNLTTMIDDITTPSGTVGVKHWAVDYSILTQAN
jgi:hypothetical protein